MKLEDILKDNIVLVIPNSIHSKVLNYLDKNNLVYDMKIISLDELVSSFLPNYDHDAVYYLMEKHDFKYDVACTYLNNIKYLNGNGHGIKKIDELEKYKKELTDNNLLFYDENLKNYYLNKEIVIYGYDYLDSFSKHVLSNCHYTFIKKENNNYEHKIYSLNSMDDEIEYVAIKIIELINQGISVDKIKLTNVTSDYFDKLDSIFKMFNIPLNHLNKGSIYETNIIKCFLDNINEKDVLESIKDKFDLNNSANNYIYSKLISILNDYSSNKYLDIKDLLINDFKKTTNYYQEYDKAIEVVDLKNNIFLDDEYVFLIGFNMEHIPVIHKDDKYIDDKIRPLFNLIDHYEENKIEKENLINTIKSIKNLTITLKTKTPFQNYEISSLNDYLNYEVININDFEDIYSNKMNHLKLACMLDNLIKYNKKDDNLDKYASSFKIPYLTYKNDFTGLDKEDLYDYLDNKLLLSYSSIDNYNKCGFRYYINNVLKLDPFEETFFINIGNIFHEVLSKCFMEDFDFESSFNDALKDMEFNSKEEFFMNILKDELKFVIDTLYEQNKLSTLDKFTCENKIYVNKDKNIKVTFMGVVDKIIHDSDNKYLVIVDYKTGNLHTNLFNTIYGIGMQLPIYVYLAKESNEFKNAEVIGFYLQKIVTSKDDEKKNEEIKLNGYTVDDPELVNLFDTNYEDSSVIKSLKCGANGFYKYSKTISKDEIDKLVKLVDTKIDEARDNILDAKFLINPKKIGDKNIGCEFCKYKDLCFMKDSNLVDLKKYDDFSFLSEEE